MSGKALSLGVTFSFMFCASAHAATSQFTFNLQKINSYVGSGDIGSGSETTNGNADRVDSGTLTINKGALVGTFTGKTITGGSYSGNTLTGATIGNADELNRWNNGLGIKGDSGDLEHSIDAVQRLNDPSEFIEMSFSRDVRLTGLTFGWVGGFSQGGANGYAGTNGAFDIILDSIAGGIGNGDTRQTSGIMTLGSPAGGYGTGSVSFGTGAGLFDDVFGLMAGVNVLPGSWKLRSVTVEFDTAPPPPPPNPVPLPAAGWMLLAGLAGLAAMRRR